MVNNLLAEMARKNITANDIAEIIGKSTKSASNKLKGNYEFTRKEMFAIKKILFPKLTLEYLFSDTG